MTSRQIGSYGGPATLIDDDKQLDVDVRLTIRQEILRAGSQEAAGLKALCSVGSEVLASSSRTHARQTS
jgi:hypothetical protein